MFSQNFLTFSRVFSLSRLVNTLNNNIFSQGKTNIISTPLASDFNEHMFAGVWSPGATPEAQRKEFNFTPVKEEAANEATEDSEPVPPVWTPRSAQASPTSERKFRPVNFESPKLGRKTYNKPSEVRSWT